MENEQVRLPLRVLADAGAWQLRKWLVKPGDKVYRNQRVAVFKSISSGAIEHALAPRAGTLHSLHIHQGVTVQASDTHIAQIQFCPHSVVFKGVCAVCGEDAEQPHFADTSTSSESRLPVAYNATSLSVTRAEAISVSTSTAHRLFRSKRLSLVLDLDHTLVHATDDPRAAALLQHSPPNVDLNSVSSFTLGPHPDTGPAAMMYLKLRPNLPRFLARVASKFELHIYTMGSRPYADRVAQLIDPDKRLFSGRITSREDFAEGRCNQKSIERLFPCDDSMVLIVDDREDVWITGTGQEFMPNLIRADPYCFWDGLHEAYDRSLPANMPANMPANTNTFVPLPAQQPAPPLAQKPSKAPNALSAPKCSDLRKPTEKTPPLSPGKCSQCERAPDRKVLTACPKAGKDAANANREGAEGEAASDHAKTNGEERGIALAHKPNGIQTEDTANVANASPAVEKEVAAEVVRRNGESNSEVEKKEQKEEESKDEGKDEKKGGVGGQVTIVPEEFRKIAKKRWDADAKANTQQHLLRLAEVLEECHSEFFRQTKKVLSRRGEEKRMGRSEFRSPVDVKEVLADMRRQVLAECVITFTGVIPTGADPGKNYAWKLALRLGATCCMDFVNGRTTHVVAAEHRGANTMKVKEAVQHGSAYVVTLKWLEHSALNFQRQDELPYCERAKQRFTSAVEFRKFVETQYAEAARALRKRGATELESICGKEVTLAVKRRKAPTQPPTQPDIRVLSGDEIGAAMDALFDD